MKFPQSLNFVAAIAFSTVILCPVISFAADAGKSASEIPVNRVILSTSGLANIEYQSQVSGDQKLEFPVRLDQVDDILKSLVVFDKKGRLGGVTLPGKQPLGQVFKDLPFTQEQLSNPMLLLNAYQGAVVTLKGVDINVTGKILQVIAEQTLGKDDHQLTRNRISVMTDSGIKQAILEDLQSIQFEDPKIRDQIAHALDSIRSNGTLDRRVLTVSLLGAGSRDVTLSYVVAAPVWKAAYRLVLPEGSGKKGLLQGWGVIENMTAADWKDVDLTLVSGNPVTYRQALYQSYYVDRPELPVQVFGRVLPRVDQGVTGTAGEMEAQAADAAAPAEAPAPMRPRMMMKNMTSNIATNSFAMAAAPEMPTGIDNLAGGANAAQSAEATTQVLFRFPDRFSLAAGQSMMLPFISHDVALEKLDVYQPETNPTHPLAAVEVKNDSDTGLPPGVLTMYEESALLHGTDYIGDAQLPVIGAGEKRLISYALDSKTTVDREEKQAVTEGHVSVAQGVLHTAVKTRIETTYTIKAPEKEDRLVVLEQPKIGNFELVTPDPSEVEVADNHYRIRVPVKAGTKKTLSVVVESTGTQAYGISGMQTEQILAYAQSKGDFPLGARKQFEKLAELRRDMDAVDQQINAIDQQRGTIFEDQSRVRENLKSLDGKSDVQQKYLSKLNDQEDQIGKLDAQKAKLAEDRRKKQADIDAFVAEMKF